MKLVLDIVSLLVILLFGFSLISFQFNHFKFSSLFKRKNKNNPFGSSRAYFTIFIPFISVAYDATLVKEKVTEKEFNRILGNRGTSALMLLVSIILLIIVGLVGENIS